MGDDKHMWGRLSSLPMPDVECVTLSGAKRLFPRERLVLRPAAYALILHEGRILLLRMRQTGKYHLPGGGVHSAESIEQTLRREVREEAGIAIQVRRFLRLEELFFYYDPSDTAYHGLHLFYLCHPETLDLLPDAEVDDGSAEKPRWVDVQGLRAEQFQAHGATIVELCRTVAASETAAVTLTSAGRPTAAKGPADLTIRDARPDDAAAIVAVLDPIIATGAYTAIDTPFPVEEERSYIASLPGRAIFHVAILGAEQRIVGFQSLEPFASYTHAFDHVGVPGTFVDLAYRRQGIATRLFAATFAAARRKGYEKLFTYVRADNPAALATYLSQGFHIIGTAQRQVKIRGEYIDEIIIERML
jgi:8-oxo-dGTP pyrophosphatase MutT (NUDIX family)/L-amino acid N-acyltransferase YncA